MSECQEKHVSPNRLTYNIVSHSSDIYNRKTPPDWWRRKTLRKEMQYGSHIDRSNLNGNIHYTHVRK